MSSTRIAVPLVLVLAFLLSASMLGLSGETVEYAEGDLAYELNDDGTAEVVGFSGSGTVTVPSEVSSEGRTYSVQSVGDSAFRRSAVTSVTLPESVRSIGELAFEGCVSLSAVELSKGLSSVGTSAFEGCTALKQVSLPDTVVSLGDRVFMDSGLESVKLPVLVLERGEDMFSGTSFREFAVPDWMNAPGENFRSCTDLVSFSSSGEKYVSSDGVLFTGDMKTLVAFPMGKSAGYTVPEGTETLGERSFVDNWRLSEITLPEGLRTIGKEAFSGTVSLSSIDFPDSLETIGRGSFSGSSVRNIVFPSSLSEIGPSAFEDCRHLDAAVMPDSLKKIGDRAFRGCDLEEIVLNQGLEYLGNRVFSSPVDYIEFPDSLQRIGYECIQAKVAVFHGEPRSMYWSSTGNGYVLGLSDDTSTQARHVEAVLDVGCVRYAVSGESAAVTGFAYRPYSDIVEVPSEISFGERTFTVSSVGPYAFAHDDWITDLAMAEHEPEPETLGSVRNVLSLPASVTVLENGCFLGALSLESALIPAGVFWVGSEAFMGCPSLTGVVVGADTIGEKAFHGCRSLQSAEIGPECVSIGVSAFSECAIERIVYPSAVMDPEVFQHNPGHTVVIGSDAVFNPSQVLYCSVEEIVLDPDNPRYALVDGVLFSKDLKKLIMFPNQRTGHYAIPEGTVTVGDFAFAECSLDGVDLPRSLVYVEEFSFAYPAFDTITVPAGVRQAEYSSFLGLTVDAECGPGVIEWNMLTTDASETVVSGNIVYVLDDEGATAMFFEPGYSSRDLLIPASIEVDGKEVPVIGVGPLAFRNSDFDTVTLPGNLRTDMMSFDNTMAETVVLTGEFDPADSSVVRTLAALNYSTESDGAVCVDGVLFNDRKELACFPYLRNGDYTVPDGTVAILPGAFAGYVQTVELPGSVTLIDDDAFSRADYLETVRVDGDQVRIDPGAFPSRYPFTLVAVHPIPGLDVHKDTVYALEVSYSCTGCPDGFETPEPLLVAVGDVIPVPDTEAEVLVNGVPSDGNTVMTASGAYVQFVFETPEPEGFPLWPVVAVILAAIILLAILRLRR